MVDATRLGAWLRSGEGIGWLVAGTMPNSLYRVPFVYLFMRISLFLFLFLCRFCLLVFFSCSHWSFVDVPLIFFCPADHVPDWQPRILLGMVEARSVNAKQQHYIRGASCSIFYTWYAVQTPPLLHYYSTTVN